jgi:signal transduction histidine kinase/tetratricopeptide (TPR) repeat protein
MKALDRGLLARRKVVLIFALAILLPAIILGYLSVRAFSGRREAVGQLLQSNLWMSGDTALREVEAKLLDREKSILHSDNFESLTESIGYGTPFLLDEKFHILIPKTGIRNPSFTAEAQPASGTEFSRIYKTAETYEFSGRDFAKAAQAYKESATIASSNRERAIALASRGRCLISAGKLNEAQAVYDELSEKFGTIRDNAGHFLGMTAAFQVYEIEKRRERKEEGLRKLLNLYQDLQNGKWPIDLAEYDFFTSEIESTFETHLQEGKPVEIINSYRALKQHPSPYLHSLLFVEFLKKDVIPKIMERTGIPAARGIRQLELDHLTTSRSEQYCLVSYAPFQDPNDGATCYRGFCWDPELLKKQVLPKILGQVSQNTGLELDTIDKNDSASTSANSLSLSYRQFPFPWKLHVTQPKLNELERSAQRENILYGALLAFITVLMFFGAILLGRDISRESETSRLKMEFVHNISHELKTPLTLIRLYGETLQRKKNMTEADRSESYEIITKESERLSHLINNVLDFSRIDMGRKEFKFKNDSLSHVVQETLDSYRYHLEKKGFEVFGEIETDVPEMSLDAEAVASILVNLLSNAMKFSSGRKEVTVRLFRRDGWAVLQVKDKGIGIAHQEQADIFKRFYRVKQDPASQTQGSGLGLTLVKHITEAHGGKVEVESAPGKGSVFSIRLPLSGPDEAEAK